MNRSRGFCPKGASEYQDQLLDRMLDTAKEGTVGVFDLDGCVFDTRTRQVAIVREFASQNDIFALFDIHEDHFVDWSIARTLSLLGLDEPRIAELEKPLYKFWAPRFFDGAYARFDAVMPGSATFIRACAQRGMRIVYLTGRHHEMREGTIAALKAYGFPYGEPDAVLITKPDQFMKDTPYKKQALEQIKLMGEPVLFVDNEPSNVNAFDAACPDAKTVFIETDHSPRPISPHPHIPWLRSWYRLDWEGSEYKLPQYTS